MDFGLAKIIESDVNLTQTNAVMGSPAYMSPEQAAGQTKNLTTAADIYSLGAVLYELVTGRPPFQGQSALDIMQQVVGRDPIPPRMIQSHIDRDLETICLKCLETDPVHRYGSAEASADDLERWLRNEPILAWQSGTLTHIHKWARRKPALARLTATTVLLLLAITIGSPIALYRINQARKAAEAEKFAARQGEYESDMLLAQQALEASNRGRALKLLEKHQPPGKSEIRNRKSEIRNRFARLGMALSLATTMK